MSKENKEEKIIHIREPFWGAWKIYGWKEKIPGIGVDRKIISKALSDKTKLLYFKIGKEETIYEIEPFEIFQYCSLKKAQYVAKYGVILFVFPRSLLKKRKEKNVRKNQ